MKGRRSIRPAPSSSKNERLDTSGAPAERLLGHEPVRDQQGARRRRPIQAGRPSTSPTRFIASDGISTSTMRPSSSPTTTPVALAGPRQATGLCGTRSPRSASVSSSNSSRLPVSVSASRSPSLWVRTEAASAFRSKW